MVEVEWLIRGFAILALWIFIVVLKQKYLDGYFQTPGPFPHQNSMVMFIGLIGNLYFAKLMTPLRKKSKLNALNIPSSFLRRISLDGIIFFSVSFCVFSSLSRAGLFFYGLSLILSAFLSFLSRFSMRQILLTMGFLFFGLLAGLKSYDTLVERITTAPTESSQVRILLAIAAVNMANSSPFGVGINNFALKINPPYSYGSHIPRSDPNQKGGLVETVYLMTAAEMGWTGLFIYLAWIFWYYFQNINNFFRYQRHKLLYIEIGLCSGLSAIYLQSTLEWVLRQTPNYYQLVIIFALIARLKTIFQQQKKA